MNCGAAALLPAMYDLAAAAEKGTVPEVGTPPLNVLLPLVMMGGEAELDVITLLLSNWPAPLLLLPAGDGMNGRYPGGMMAAG